MADEGGSLRRYSRMLQEPLPEFTGDVERLFVSVLKSIAKANDVEEESGAYNAIFKLQANLSIRMRKRYSYEVVLLKIVQLRRLFVDFRRFIDLPYVGYDERRNEVAVTPDYFQMLPNRENAKQRSFRISGCPHYKNLKIIFVHNRFHLLVDEPADLFWNEIPRRNGDDPPPNLNELIGNNHDSDADSDYVNEVHD